MIAHTEQIRPDLLIIDSIQTISTETIESAPGSVSQVRECTSAILKYAKKTNLPIAAVRAFLEITAMSVGWYLGGTVGIGTLFFAFGIGPAVALGLFVVGKSFN